MYKQAEDDSSSIDSFSTNSKLKVTSEINNNFKNSEKLSSDKQKKSGRSSKTKISLKTLENERMFGLNKNIIMF